jgi:hypothetical protein
LRVHTSCWFKRVLLLPAGQAATSGGVNWEPIQLEPVGNATREHMLGGGSA